MTARDLASSNESNSEGDTPDRRIPLVILGGFLGAGKTTVLNHLLRTANGRKIAALVNDVGEINIDADLIKDVAKVDSKSADEVVELSNGCICCGIQDAFGEAVVELAKRSPDCIIVEATGIAEPQRIIASLASQDEEGVSSLDFVRIANIVTLIDADWWVRKIKEAYQPIRRSLLLYSDPRRPLSELLTLQVECANVIVLNKIDLVDDDSLRRSRSAAAAIAPSAKILATREGGVEIEELIDKARFDLSTTFEQSGCDLEFAKSENAGKERSKTAAKHDHGEFGLMTFAYRSRIPINHDKLVAYLRRGIPGLLRAKGFAWTDREPDRIAHLSLAGNTLRLDYLGKWLHAMVQSGDLDRSQIPASAWRRWDSKTGDRRQEIVFIGIDLDRDAIEMELNSILVTQ